MEPPSGSVQQAQRPLFLRGAAGEDRHPDSQKGTITILHQRIDARTTKHATTAHEASFACRECMVMEAAMPEPPSFPSRKSSDDQDGKRPFPFSLPCKEKKSGWADLNRRPLAPQPPNVCQTLSVFVRHCGRKVRSSSVPFASRQTLSVVILSPCRHPVKAIMKPAVKVHVKATTRSL